MTRKQEAARSSRRHGLPVIFEDGRQAPLPRRRGRFIAFELPGDAELESWDMMEKKCRSELKPVDFLKVAHHGSHNGTPLELLDLLLPARRKAQAQVLVSTKRKVYGTKNPVPDDALLKELKSRCHKLVTTDGATGTSVELSL